MSKLIIFIAIQIILCLYIVPRLAAHAPEPDGARWVWVVGLMFFSLQAMAFPSTGMDRSLLPVRILSFLSYTAMGVILSMFVYVLAADVIKLCVMFFSDDMNENLVATWFFWGVLLFTVFTTGVGMVQAMSGPVVQAVGLKVKNLPPSLDGYRLALFSDLHVGPITHRRYVQNIVDMINAEKPDAVIAAGDFTDGAVHVLREDMAPLRNIVAADGVFFAPGNHEYYRDLGNWLKFYREIGWHVLLNQHATLKDGKLVIGGVLDYGTHSLPAPHATDPFKAAEGAPADAYKILIAHQPSDYKRAAEAGFDLMLSGHTHGGQFFPWTIFVPMVHKFAEGLGRFGNMDVFVTRGVGFWGPPLRTFSRAEIVVITLQKG